MWPVIENRPFVIFHKNRIFSSMCAESNGANFMIIDHKWSCDHFYIILCSWVDTCVFRKYTIVLSCMCPSKYNILSPITKVSYYILCCMQLLNIVSIYEVKNLYFSRRLNWKILILNIFWLLLIGKYCKRSIFSHSVT